MGTSCLRGEGAGVFMHQLCESLLRAAPRELGVPGSSGHYVGRQRRPWAKAIRSQPEGSEVSIIGYGLT